MYRIFTLFFLILISGNAIARAADTWAEKLGYPPDKRVLILHANYMGAAYEFNRPGQELLKNGHAQAASVMVPCPWFEDFASWCRQNPGHDVGICLTLNSPGESYRWRPLGDREQTSSLVDADGYLWQTELQLALRGETEQARLELKRQIDKARASGIRPSHLLPFKGSLLARPDLLELYLEIAQQLWIPAVMVELTPDTIEMFRDEGFPLSDEMIDLIARYPLPKLDELHFIPDAESYDAKRDSFYELVRGLPPGLTQIICGPADKTPALERITPNWQNRVFERQLLMDPEVHKFLENEGIVLTDWKEVMERFETGSGPAAGVDGTGTPARGSAEQPRRQTAS